MLPSKSAAPPQQVRAFAYHEISRVPSRDVYTLSPEQFSKHLETIHACQLLDRTVAITFDDGHWSNIQWAAPTLQAFALQGMFFITTDWMSRKPGFMSWDDVRSLADAGHTIGSHTASHPFLTQASAIQIERELSGSRRKLEDQIGRQVTAISMPGGRWNVRVLRACAAAGYEAVYTSEPGDLQPLSDQEKEAMPKLIGRFAVRRKTRLTTIAAYAKGDVYTSKMLQLSYHLRKNMRATLGDAGYQRLWSHFFRAAPTQASGD